MNYRWLLKDAVLSFFILASVMLLWVTCLHPGVETVGFDLFLKFYIAWFISMGLLVFNQKI